jgi:hypothetical protein
MPFVGRVKAPLATRGIPPVVLDALSPELLGDEIRVDPERVVNNDRGPFVTETSRWLQLSWRVVDLAEHMSRVCGN